jgi:hypothetical protein
MASRAEAFLAVRLQRTRQTFRIISDVLKSCLTIRAFHVGGVFGGRCCNVHVESGHSSLRGNVGSRKVTVNLGA